MKYLSLIIIILMVFIGFLITNYTDTQAQNTALQTKVENLQRDNQVQMLTIQAQEQQINELKIKDSEILIVPESSDWQIFEATVYTSSDPGCNSISHTEINIEQLDKYFNFCAVDPDIVPFGSIVIVLIDGKEVPFLAVDIGAAIKGNKLDLYINDYEKAINFGRQNLIARIIGKL